MLRRKKACKIINQIPATNLAAADKSNTLKVARNSKPGSTP